MPVDMLIDVPRRCALGRQRVVQRPHFSMMPRVPIPIKVTSIRQSDVQPLGNPVWGAVCVLSLSSPHHQIVLGLSVVSDVFISLLVRRSHHHIVRINALESVLCDQLLLGMVGVCVELFGRHTGGRVCRHRAVEGELVIDKGYLVR